MVLGQGLRFTVTGLVVGIAAAFGLTPAAGAQLFNVKPTDPATIVSVAAFIAFVAMAACLIGQQGGEGGSDGGSPRRVTVNFQLPREVGSWRLGVE